MSEFEGTSSRLLQPSMGSVAPVVRFFVAERFPAASSVPVPALPYAVIGVFVKGRGYLELKERRTGDAGCGVFVIGPLTAPGQLRFEGDVYVVGAVLHIGALTCLFDADVQEFTDRMRDVRSLLPAEEVDDLLSALAPDLPFDMAIARLTTWMKTHLRYAEPRLMLPQSLWDLPLAEIASRLRVSPRHCQRLILRNYGVNLRQLRCYSRYWAALKVVPENPYNASVSLAKVAAASGYFDQAHMAHDFVKYLGQSPTKVLKKNGGNMCLRFLRNGQE